MSDDRLKENLRKAAVPDAAIANFDRTSLQAAWAELIATGRDKPVTAAVTYTDPEVEQRRQQFEERKWADEMSLRSDEIKIRTAELDAHHKQLKLESEKVRLEQERLRLQIEKCGKSSRTDQKIWRRTSRRDWSYAYRPCRSPFFL